MLDAGVKIAGHTEAVGALNNTLSAAGKMGEVAPVIEEDEVGGQNSCKASRGGRVMIPILAFATLAVVLIIVLVVAYHLIGIYVALKRGADHLESLAGGLVAIRTIPLR